MGPPGTGPRPPDRGTPPPQPPALIKTDSRDNDSPAGRRYAAGLRRRRAASWRLAGGDPWRPDRPALSHAQITGAAHAAAHLLDAGLPPVFDLETLRALRRAGHRRTVTKLMELAG